jgi:ketosteroid isomerase-like protein
VTDLDPLAFAGRWVAEWNANDVEAVLAHFAEDCVFVSPKAVALVGGGGHVVGKPALRDYWTKAVTRFPGKTFRLESAQWNPEARTLVIFYVSILDGNAVHTIEVMRFGEDGLVARGEAYYGAPATA